MGFSLPGGIQLTMLYMVNDLNLTEIFHFVISVTDNKAH